MSKMADRLILRLISQDSPGSVSTGVTPRQKISKVVDSRDARVLFVREKSRILPSCFPFEEQTWFQLLDSEIINAKVLLRTRDDNWPSRRKF